MGNSTFDTVKYTLLKQLERLDEVEVGTDEATAEIARARAINAICMTIASNARVALDTAEFLAKARSGVQATAGMLEASDEMD